MYERKYSILKKYFSTSDAEVEKEIFDKIYVTLSEINSIIDFNSQTIRILVGNKGCGKSAIIEHILRTKCDEFEKSIRLEPNDFIVSDFPSGTSCAVIKNTVTPKIIRELCAKIGKEYKGLLSPEKNAMYIASKEKEKMVSNELQKLKNLFDMFVKINLGESVSFENELTDDDYINGLSACLEAQNTKFYVLIDNIDQCSNTDTTGYFDIIWGVIQAFSTIAKAIPNLRIIITVRADIWRRISHSGSMNRADVDKFRNCVKYVNPTREHIREILRKRIEICANEIEQLPLDKKHNIMYMYSLLFEGKNCKISEKNIDKKWEEYLVTSSRERPRDTVQLMNKLIEQAEARGAEKISSNDALSTLFVYSQERVDDIVNENHDRCPDLLKLINYFYDSNFEMPFNEVMNKLKNAAGINVKLNSVAMKNDYDSALMLLDFLYQIEFLTARKVDNQRREEYRYIRPYENPNLITGSFDLENYIWDIHPCYRAYLMSQYDRKKRMMVFSQSDSKKGKKAKRRVKR